jgi:D-alanine-D-alanine ligase
MRIGFTYDLKTDHVRQDGLPEDALAEFDAEETIAEIESAIQKGGHEVVRIGHVRNLLARLPHIDVDIVFNICEGVGNRNRESEVPLILDLFRIPYVGSDSLSMGLTLDKVMAKKAFVADNVPTPKYFVADGSFKKKDSSGMKFPMIVKPRHEGSSKGISEDSIVKNSLALGARISQVRSTYNQAALVEEFIQGQEFTVLVIGNREPEALAPVHIQILGKLDIGNLIYTSRRVNNTDVEYVCPAKVSKSLDKKLREIAVKAYRSVDCRDFGRVDFRVDKHGRPYVLELNPLPSLSTYDVFPLVAKAQGLTYAQLVLKVLDAAIQRCGLN